MSALQGNPDLVEQPITRGKDGQTGPFITRTWKGTEDACNAALDEIIGADHAEVTGDGAVYTLTARFANDPNSDPTPEVPQHEERLHFNRVSKSIYEHPNYAGLSFGTKAVIRQAMEEHATASPASIAGNAPAIELYQLLLEGVESFVVNQAVVIVTDTASAGFAWTIGFGDVGKVFSTSAMIADADLSSGWAVNLPVGSGSSLFHSGWLKGPPEITTVGGNRSQLVQEYEFGLWTADLYTYIASTYIP